MGVPLVEPRLGSLTPGYEPTEGWSQMAASQQVGRLSGWVVFASVMMGLAGAFSVIDGLVAHVQEVETA